MWKIRSDCVYLWLSYFVLHQHTPDKPCNKRAILMSPTSKDLPVFMVVISFKGHITHFLNSSCICNSPDKCNFFLKQLMLVAAELYEVCIGAQGQLDQQLGHRGIFNLSIKLLLLPPATKLGQGIIFRSECREFCSQGGSGPLHAGITPSPAPEADPPHGSWPPPPSRLPSSRYPPAQSMLGDTGIKRAVRILLECMLVKKTI